MITYLVTTHRNFGIAALLILGACGPGGSGDEETGGTSGGGPSTSGADTGGSTGAPTSSGDGESSGTPTSGGTGSSGGESTSGTTGPLVCTAPPLSDEQIDNLAFGVFGNEFEAKPGDQRMLKIGVLECCYFLTEVDACVEYTLEPAEGASYDPDSGILTIEDGAAAGTVYTLTADVEDGRRVVEATVTVYTEESNPLVGIWHEVAQTPCGMGDDTPPMPAIGELWFEANGDVNVTWEPFEIYVDYWGTYTYDLQTGALEIMVDGGNYVPPDVDGSGTFAIDNGALVLTDMWLGSAVDFMGEPACGHRFER